MSFHSLLLSVVISIIVLSPISSCRAFQAPWNIIQGGGRDNKKSYPRQSYGGTTRTTSARATDTKNFLSSPNSQDDPGDFPRISSSKGNLATLRKQASNLAMIETLLTGSSITDTSSSLIRLQFVGKGSVGPKESSTNCIFVAPKDVAPAIKDSPLRGGDSLEEYCPSLPIPLPAYGGDDMLKLLSFAYKARPISKSLCLALNPLLVNRDGALFDNLPYARWTIDPLKRNRDAARNPIDEKYHLGKRDAYNRFMGKDWYGRSLSVGNVAARIQYMLQADDDDKEEDATMGVGKKNVSVKTLAQRVLELEVQEARMALAEAEEQFAILRSKLNIDNLEQLSDEILLMQYDALEEGMRAVKDAQESLEEREEALASMINQGSGVQKKSILSDFLDGIMDREKSDAPYRGAIGYKPVIDSQDEMFQKSILPYSSPFEMMKEIIDEQLNAEVIGCIIEDTSLFEGSTIFGGGVVIQRKGRKKTIQINGETIELDDGDDDFGNDGIQRGETMIVECDVDEAIGMALACDVDIFMERAEWDRSKIGIPAVFQSSDAGGTTLGDLPMLQTPIDTVVMETQGEGKVSKNTKIQVPRGRGDNPLMFLGPMRRGGSQPTTTAVFDTKIPVQSLSEYDALTIQEKAQLLLSLDSFNGRLPRPRQLRSKTTTTGDNDENNNNSVLNLLDELLLPLIDESVRRQVLIRMAEQKKDVIQVEELERNKSRRQIAKENADMAREQGKEELAAMWEKEADFFASLRADATQDEGSYNRFLDRDEWYERTRQKIAEKNKNKFRSLLDGSLE